MELIDKKQTRMLEELKNINISEFAGYELQKLLFNTTMEAIQMPVKKTVKEAVKSILGNKYKFEFVEENPDNRHLIFTVNYNRSDHKKSWEQYKQVLDSYDEIYFDRVGFDINRRLPARQIFKSVVTFIKFCIGMKIHCTFKEKLVLVSHLVELYRLKQELDNFELKYGLMTQFFDGSEHENLFAQYCKMRGIITVTLQHGQPIFTSNEHDRWNQTMLLNFTSDYVIVPGEFSKKQYELAGVASGHIKLLGSLRELKKVQKKNYDVFLVLLDCPAYEWAVESNKEMLRLACSIAEKFNIKFRVKCHPQDSPCIYAEYVSEYGEILDNTVVIDKALENVDFTIIHISGAYLDALAYGVKSFCYTNEIPHKLIEFEQDRFREVKELEQKVGDWYCNSLQDKEKYFSEVREHYLYPDGSANRHKEFIDSLLKE